MDMHMHNRNELNLEKSGRAEFMAGLLQADKRIGQASFFPSSGLDVNYRVEAI